MRQIAQRKQFVCVVRDRASSTFEPLESASPFVRLRLTFVSF